MSPHRKFRCEDGLVWQAWDVVPTWGERRVAQRRQNTQPPPDITGERRIADRRRRQGIRIGLSEALTSGWLAFECQGMRRRVAPIPAGWDELPEEELCKIWRDAELL